eukprot:539584-Rhodomonas_salina.1
MASEIAAEGLDCPSAALEEGVQAVQGALSSATSRNEVQSAANSAAQNSNSKASAPQTTQPASNLPRASRKRTASCTGAQEAPVPRKDAKEEARHYLHLVGYHGEYALATFAHENGIKRTTLQYHLKQISDEEKLAIKDMAARKAADDSNSAAKIKTKEKRAATIARKALEAAQIGQDKLHLNSGVTFPQYSVAHKWGVTEIVQKRATPKEAADAVLEKFGATITPDCLRMQARRFVPDDEIPDVTKAGYQCKLPRAIEEGLVEIIELFRSNAPPFPVFKYGLLKRVQRILRAEVHFQHIWAENNNYPTDRWYYGFLQRWADRLGTAKQNIIEADRAKWATSQNLQLYFNVVYERFKEIGFIEVNPAFEPDLSWTREREKAKDKRIERGFWTTRGKLRTISYDESEATTNASRNQSNSMAEGTIIAKKVEVNAGAQGYAVGNKTSTRASAIGGSNCNGDSLPIVLIYSTPVRSEWFQHPDFALPECTWTNPATGKPFEAKVMSNESGGATNASGMMWLQWLLCEPVTNQEGELEEWTGERGGVFRDASPDNPIGIICDGHGSHLSLLFLRLCKKRGVALIWRPPHTSHVSQGEDVVNFLSLKRLLRIATAEALEKKHYLQPPYDDILAWGGAEMKRWSTNLGNCDLGYCLGEAWTTAFNPDNCEHSWSKPG